MATITSLPGPQPERRGLSYWMERVLKELEEVRKAPDADAVHDLRVAIRRCRSMAAVMQEVDPDPAWAEMRRVPRKLFRKLGELRDAQVMDEWVKKLAPDHDPVRIQLHVGVSGQEQELRDMALRAAEKFDDKEWSRPGAQAAQARAVRAAEEPRGAMPGGGAVRRGEGVARRGRSGRIGQSPGMNCGLG